MSAITNSLDELTVPQIPAPTRTATKRVGQAILVSSNTLNVTATGDPVTEPPADLVVKSLFELRDASQDRADELLRDRFLCRHGSLLIVGSTGIGKSSLTMQMMMRWALGMECFGIEPTRPLKSLLVQGENDEADLAAMRDGVARSMALTDEQTAEIDPQIMVCHENARVGYRFVSEVLEPLVADHCPDLLWIDPVFQYLGGDSNQQEVVSEFLRQQLGPLLKAHNCAVVLVHHTAKPSKVAVRSRNHAQSAYDAAGSAEFSNWPRAVLSLQSTTQADTYRLVAGKRGGRLSWRMPDGVTRKYAKALRHAREPGVIFWEDAEQGNLLPPAMPTGPATLPELDPAESAVLAQLPAEGVGIDKQIVMRAVNQQTSIGVNRVRAAITALVAAGRVREQQVPRAGRKPEVQLVLQQPPPTPPTAPEA